MSIPLLALIYVASYAIEKRKKNCQLKKKQTSKQQQQINLEGYSITQVILQITQSKS